MLWRGGAAGPEARSGYTSMVSAVASGNQPAGTASGNQPTGAAA